MGEESSLHIHLKYSKIELMDRKNLIDFLLIEFSTFSPVISNYFIFYRISISNVNLHRWIDVSVKWSARHVESEKNIPQHTAGWQAKLMEWNNKAVISWLMFNMMDKLIRTIGNGGVTFARAWMRAY